MNDRQALYAYLSASYVTGGLMFAALKFTLLSRELSALASQSLREGADPTEAGIGLIDATINILLPFWVSFEIEDIAIMILYIIVGALTLAVVGSTYNSAT